MRDTLDTALDELNEADRQAIILRFFEGRSYPAMGHLLGLKEETARMRVGRALDKLRTRLARRGFASTSAVLGGVLASHGTLAAPPGLAATVTTTVAASAGLLAIPTAGLISLMTTTKLLGTLATVAAIAGVTVLVHHFNAPESDQTRRPAPVAQIQRPSSGPDATAPTISDKRAPVPLREITSRPVVTSPDQEEAAEKIAELRSMLTRLPEQSIPELKLATHGDWTIAVDGSLESPEDFRRALGKIRTAAEARFAKLAHEAVRAYLKANGNQFPADPLQLLPFASPEIDRAMLARYKVVPAADIPNLRMGGDQIITQVARIDSDYDSTTVIGPQGVGSTRSPPTLQKELETIRPLIRAYEANHGRRHSEIKDLLPLATTPEQKAVLGEWQRRANLPQ
ncbi:MAG: hypothetical protein JNK23_18110 [Opitutaceae bacterium]|nr:hypothetical protein [Opitutaceae bacterium]